jgi:hypothetical protein
MLSSSDRCRGPARGLVFPNKSVGMTIFWSLMAGVIVALLFEVIGGGPPSEVPPG